MANEKRVCYAAAADDRLSRDSAGRRRMEIYPTPVVSQRSRRNDTLYHCFERSPSTGRRDWKGGGATLPGLFKPVPLAAWLPGIPSEAQNEALQGSKGISTDPSKPWLGGSVLPKTVLPGLLFRLRNQPVPLDVARVGSPV